MTRKVKVAIVIPVFNVEKYLPECLDSILNQTFTDFVAIAVNDGSTDSSHIILNDYAKKDPRIIVIHQKNQGVSSARNTALRKIENTFDIEYISFIDADDKVERNFFECLVKESENSNSDLAICPTILFNKNGIIPPNQQNICKKILNRDEFSLLYFELDEHIHTSISYRFLCNKFIKYSLVKGIFFNENLSTAEDQDWIIRSIIPTVKKCIITKETNYLYRLRKSSASHTCAICQDFESLSDIAEKNILNGISKIGLTHRLVESIYLETLNCHNTNDKKRATLISKKTITLLIQSKLSRTTIKQKRRLLLSAIPYTITHLYFLRRIKKHFKENNIKKTLLRINYNRNKLILTTNAKQTFRKNRLNPYA